MRLLSNPNLINKLGILAVCLLAVIIIFQLLMAFRILPTSIAWGGRLSESTSSLRRASFTAVLILGGFAYVIARRAGLLGSPVPSRLIKIMSWLVTLYLVLNTVLNFISTSPFEKYMFGPLTLVLVIVCLLISISSISDI